MTDNHKRPDITACVFPDETLLWQGHPEARLQLPRGNIRNAVVWGIIAICLFIVFLRLDYSSSVKLQMGLATAALLIYALYISVGKMYLSRAVLRRTSYAITSKRALSLQTGFNGGRAQYNIMLNDGTKAAIGGPQDDTLSFWLIEENPTDEYDGTGLQFEQIADAAKALSAYKTAKEDSQK